MELKLTQRTASGHCTQPLRRCLQIWMTLSTLHYQQTNTPTEEEMNSAKPADYKQYMQSAATLVLSTKVSWWMTNHHVGQGKGFQSNIHLRTRSNWPQTASCTPWLNKGNPRLFQGNLCWWPSLLWPEEFCRMVMFLDPGRWNCAALCLLALLWGCGERPSFFRSRVVRVVWGGNGMPWETCELCKIHWGSRICQEGLKTLRHQPHAFSLKLVKIL